LYSSHDGLGLAELVRRGDVTAKELVEAAIERIERLNPALNAVVHKMYHAARRAADGELPDGPFKGVPILLKDLLSWYGGERITSGSRLFKDFVAPHDSEYVKRVRATGAIVVGKTNTPEFGLTPFTEPELFGPARNPWNPERTTSGSSGGSAAAVASGMVPVAGGGDGGGSIRMPASCCGIFGLKPTRGRTPSGPDNGELWRGAAIEHVLTRSVRDSAAMLDATLGADVGAPYWAQAPLRPYLDEVAAEPAPLRVAFTARSLMGRNVHADCHAAVQDAAKLLESLGHHVEEAAPPLDRERFNRAFILLVAGETRADLDDARELLGRTARREDVEYTTWVLALVGAATSASEYSGALRYLQRASRKIGAFFEQYDVLLTPTVASPPFPHGALQPTAAERQLLRTMGRVRGGRLMRALGMVDKLADTVYEFMPFTAPFNVTGQPGMSVPLYWNTEGLPIGVQFVGRYGDEATLFRLAGQLERARPWFARTPPIFG
jgi:amidase